MSLLRKTCLGLAVSSMATLGVVAAGPASAVDGGFTATAGDLYGALALSKSTGNVAYAVNYGSYGAADTAAIAECGGGDCEVVVHFANACGAVSQGADTRFGWAWAATKVEAEQAAIDVLGNSAPSFPDAGSASPRQAKVILSACTDNAR
ncbi:DUF4189 domain-containing protein [Nocardia otitidiscaviarum]|uniref:DUF4189 domain-containing protein n=1 Tax=Nocardia otitidiscaviarum TaxID=1823 RepID=UPI001895374E|nr:DUF4189 domain-containing protein [Nocardia otitidiscaviarum]MBF6180832.1 DUF4189 domain-containing protein [Nocardia otitidiscaviarum]